MDDVAGGLMAENSRYWQHAVDCQAERDKCKVKLEAFRVRLAKHEACAEELRAARAALLATPLDDDRRVSSRFWDALEAFEELLQEDAVE